MTQNAVQSGDLVKFLRRRDYKIIKELGQGACGKTVLLHDEQIDEFFVCKKYVPYSQQVRRELFDNFVREVKLLHQVYHDNVVRVFNHYLYPDDFAGYLLMEYVDGSAIDQFLAAHPEQTNEIFLQAISGFAHLERAGILHRDIRPGNLMVRADGRLKIIDLGFGKRVTTSDDFDKSITLNWWCATPEEFRDAKYNFQTEVYFVGKLFERVIQDNAISHFKYTDLLRSMCHPAPSGRVGAFSMIETLVRRDPFLEIEFTEAEVDAYREFAAALAAQVTKIEGSSKYTVDLGRIETALADAYRTFMLEREVPDAAVVIRCFMDGTYYYRKTGLAVAAVKKFLMLLKASTEEKKRIVLANLHTKLDAVQRYEASDEVPF